MQKEIDNLRKKANKYEIEEQRILSEYKQLEANGGVFWLRDKLRELQEVRKKRDGIYKLIENNKKKWIEEVELKKEETLKSLDKTIDNIPSKDITELSKIAKKYKTFQEFKWLIRWSSTQYGEYLPKVRKYTQPTAKNLGDIEWLDPNGYITVYRWLDVKNVGNKWIKKWDFVTTDYDDALAYTDSPSKVVSLRTKIKNFIAEYPDEVDIKDTKNPISYELIYNPDWEFVKVTDTKLRKIREEANK